MVARQVKFYLDPISPYAYLAWHHLKRLSKTTTVPLDIQVVPILFAGLLGAHGQKGPAEIKSKRRFMFLDCARTAKTLNIPFRLPPAHPFNPLQALRLLTAVDDAAQRRLLTGAILCACWGEGRSISDQTSLKDIVTATLTTASSPSVTTSEVSSLFVRAEATEAKQLLRANTDDAIASGVFGVPSILIPDSKALFWGSDRIETHLAEYLAGNLDIDMEAFDRMLDVPRGADRRNVEVR